MAKVLSYEEVNKLISPFAKDWQIIDNEKKIKKHFKFK